MEARDVLDVLEVLGDGGVLRVWLTGGWGVDALLGAQHRDHGDLDLLLARDDVDRALQLLAGVGFSVTVDGRPTQMTLADREGRRVDLLPLFLEPDGTGWQAAAGTDGADLRYPAEAFTYGWVGGERVGCLGPELQIDLHTGYEPTAVDRADMARLQERFTLPLPDPYV